MCGNGLPMEFRPTMGWLKYDDNDDEDEDIKIASAIDDFRIIHLILFYFNGCQF